MWLIIILIYALASLGCATVRTMKQEIPVKTEIWREEALGAKKAVVLILHGLNLKPQRMDDWAHILSEHGAYTLRFALYGHGDDKTAMANVTADIWRAQFIDAVGEAQKISIKEGIPLYFMGFSLGGLVGLEWLAHKPEENKGFDKMVLIAPALSAPWYSRAAINSLAIFGRGLTLPSRSPEQYRVNKGTTIAAYQALFGLKDALFQQGFHNTNIDTLILIDKNDELIDSKHIRQLIWDNKLSHWQIVTVDNRYAHDTYGFRHLMVDQEAVGHEVWQSIKQQVLAHLGL